MESLPKLRGTRSSIVVPRRGRDSIENVPFTSFRRCSILMRASLPSIVVSNSTNSSDFSPKGLSFPFLIGY